MNYESMSKAELIRILKSRDTAAKRRKCGVSNCRDARGQARSGVLCDDSSMICLDDSPALIWRAGTDAKCDYFNRAWLAFTGRSMEFSLGDGWVEDVHPDDVQACVSRYLAAFSSRRSFELEYRMKRFDGEYRWIIDVGHVLRGADGLFSGYIGLCLDITERKIVENTLSAFFSASPVGMVIFDDKLRYLRINETLASINGFPVEAHYGKLVSDIVPNLSPFIEDAFRMILKTGETLSNVEYSGETPMHPGVVRHFVTSYFPICGCDGKPAYIGVTVVDITDLKRAEEEMLVYQEQLKSLAEDVFLAEERERRRIAGELHDQIGQTLALAMIRLKTLVEELTGRSAADKLLSIVSLIDDSIREIRILTFKISPPQLFEVGLETALVSLCERLSVEHDLDFSVVTPPESVSLREELRVMLFGVIRELLANVIKHAEARQVSVILLYDDNFVTVLVEDDGKGFDAEDFRLFRRKKGGFGLFNIKQKVEYAGGSFQLDSTLGKGTKISIGFPLLG